jgi:NAD(P)H-dependent FMN reductase
MRAIILNGGRSSDDGADGVENVVTAALADRECESDSLVLRHIPIAYCQGCFECWVKTPGVCKIVDAGRGVAQAIIRADLVIAVTPITFGGYSSELKKAIDRTICLVSPFFRRIEHEVHHRRRYDRYPAWLGIGLLPAPAADEERIFRAAGVSQCNQLPLASSRQRHRVREPGDSEHSVARRSMARSGDVMSRPPRRALLLIGSAKPKGTSTSESLACHLIDRLLDAGVATQMLFISHVHGDRHTPALLAAVDSADLLIVFSPLYVDSLPHLVVRAFERIAAHRQAQQSPRPCRFLAVLNCGFPEASQCATALEICRVFSERARYDWAGGLALGGGEAIHGRQLEKAGGMVRHAIAALDLVSVALSSGSVVPERVAALMAKTFIPGSVYTLAGNLGWILRAQRHHVVTKLGARPYATADHS